MFSLGFNVYFLLFFYFCAGLSCDFFEALDYVSILEDLLEAGFDYFTGTLSKDADELEDLEEGEEDDLLDIIKKIYIFNFIIINLLKIIK